LKVTVYVAWIAGSSVVTPGMVKEDDVGHDDCCWQCCRTGYHRLHNTGRRMTVGLVEWTGYARFDRWTPAFAVDRWDLQSPTTQTSRTSTWKR